jgi:hypothetical protein
MEDTSMVYRDPWQVSDRRYLSEGSMTLLNRPNSPTIGRPGAGL